MKEIMEIAEKNDLFVIEDSCEALGTEINGKKVGSIGNLGTFSFYYSHHISTIEGGMIISHDDEISEMCRSMRSFGWIRDIEGSDKIAKNYPSIDPRFLFINMGFNLRPTELQGAIGIHQMKKLEKFLEIRKTNAEYWNKRLEPFNDLLLLHSERKGTKHSWFAYQITVKTNAFFTKKDLIDHLESKGIETRPVVAGDITKQPVMKNFEWKSYGSLKNSTFIQNNSFFIGNHQGIGPNEREYVADVLEDFLTKKKRD